MGPVLVSCAIGIFSLQKSKKVADMTALAGKLIVIALAAGFSVAALAPASAEAGVIQGRPLLAPPAGADAVRVRCERSLSNLWSCNDDLTVRDRYVRAPVRRNGERRYAYHPCDHSSETARDGSRCGNRAADRKPGGR